jgi:hypothetical protein
VNRCGLFLSSSVAGRRERPPEGKRGARHTGKIAKNVNELNARIRRR